MMMENFAITLHFGLYQFSILEDAKSETVES